MGSCRFCGKRGHNRNGCPDVAAHAASGKAKLEAGKDRYELDWRERFAVSIADNKANRSIRASTAPRKCSYCNETGHTRAKCETLTQDRAAAFTHEKTFRTNFANWLVNSGIGVGSIITRKNWDGREWSILLTKVSYDGINIMNPNGQNAIRGQYLDREGWEGDVATLNIAPKRTFGFEISAPSVPAPLPENFLSDEAIAETVNKWFDEKSTRRTRWNDASIGCFNQYRPDFAELTEKAKYYAV